MNREELVSCLGGKKYLAHRFTSSIGYNTTNSVLAEETTIKAIRIGRGY